MFRESKVGTEGRAVLGATGKSKVVSIIKSFTGALMFKGLGTEGKDITGSASVNAGPVPIETVGKEIDGDEGKVLVPKDIEGAAGAVGMFKPTLDVVLVKVTFGVNRGAVKAVSLSANAPAARKEVLAHSSTPSK
jgi:hypothetical protein